MQGKRTDKSKVRPISRSKDTAIGDERYMCVPIYAIRTLSQLDFLIVSRRNTLSAFIIPPDRRRKKRGPSEAAGGSGPVFTILGSEFYEDHLRPIPSAVLHIQYLTLPIDAMSSMELHPPFFPFSRFFLAFSARPRLAIEQYHYEEHDVY